MAEHSPAKDREYGEYKRTLLAKINSIIGIDGTLAILLEFWGDSPPDALIDDIVKYYDLMKEFFERE